MRGLTVFLVALVGVGLAGCARKDPNLMHAKVNTPKIGPDAFSVVPYKDLQTPPDPKALPVPTPGSANLADPNPSGDAIAALGGKQSAERRVPQASALIAAVNRYGTDPNIRSELSAADLRFRRQHRGKPLEQLFNLNVYYKAYAAETLDPYAELTRLAKRGIAVPDAPPDPQKLKP